MSVELSYEAIAAEFDLLRAVFESGWKDPFRFIELQRPSRYCNLKNNDESHYIAIITLSGGYDYRVGFVKEYQFKIRADGCFVYNIPFEYAKQSIGKWVKYVSRWLNEIESFSGLRQQARCLVISQELMIRTLALEKMDFLGVFYILCF